MARTPEPSLSGLFDPAKLNGGVNVAVIEGEGARYGLIDSKGQCCHWRQCANPFPSYRPVVMQCPGSEGVPNGHAVQQPGGTWHRSSVGFKRSQTGRWTELTLL
jgi:hypothetical protein